MATVGSLEHLRSFADRTEGLGAGEFGEKHPHPFLLLELREKETGEATADTSETLSPRKASEEQFVAPVRKAKGRHAFTFVSIGRAGNNDIVVAGPTISKVHAFLIPPKDEADDWKLRDAGSTNGTQLNGVDIPAGVERDLHEGDEFLLGDALKATWFSREGFHRYLEAVR